jgi:hypothetical protein
MAKVKEFKGHKVPDGATHYAEENGACWGDSFLKKVDGKWLFKYVSTESGEFSPCHKLPDHAIEIPEEFKPEMGKDCEVFIDLEWVVCCFVGINFNGDYVFYKYEGSNGAGFHPTHNIENFRPLQTEEEKAREAFMDAGTVSYLDCEDANVNDHDLELLLGQMFEDGFKAPEDK